jgi:RHS repeat-associated protein
LQAAAVLNRIGSCSTGKERDTESGNDYFEARYYSSAMGRFMSPDWSAKEEPVPYARMDNPQTLNLYAYLMNNPLGGVDADGHCPPGVDCSKVTVEVKAPDPSMLENVKTSDGQYRSGPGTIETITIKDGGQPLSGVAVKESNTPVGTGVGTSTIAENPGSQTTSPAGTIKDVVMNQQTQSGSPMDHTGNNPNSPTPSAKEMTQLTNSDGYSSTTRQTLTFSTPAGASCSASYERTLGNKPDANGFPTAPVNGNGTNYTFSYTTPVVKTN